MNDTKDFIIENGVLKQYVGSGGDVVIPEGVTSIGNRVFNGNIAITSVFIPEGVKKIGLLSFANCYSLESVHFPDSIEEIGDGAFTDCKSLRTAEIPEGCASLGVGVFVSCSALESVRLPSGLKKIRNDLFSGCKNLRECLIPGSVTAIGDRSFMWCENLSLIKILGRPKLSLLAFGNTQKISESAARPIWCPEIELASIPKPYVKAAVRGFVKSYREDLEQTVIRREEYISYLKTNRKKYYDDVVSDEAWLMVFLAEEVISKREGQKLLEWGEGKLTPEMRAALLEYTREEQPDYDLALDDTDTRRSIKALNQSWTYTALADGTQMITSYKGDEDVIEIPAFIGKKAVTVIGQEAFTPFKRRCTNETARRNIKKVIVPEGVKTLKEGAFYGCRNLCEVSLPEGLTAIQGGKYMQEGVFTKCVMLTQIILPQSLCELGEYAFLNCTALSEIDLPQNLKTIGMEVFMNCSSLGRISIPETVKSIGYAAFDGCPNLTIYAPAGSYAEQYAKENNIPFVAE